MPSKTSENIDPDNAKITSEQRPFTVIVEGNIGSGEILLSQFTYSQVPNKRVYLINEYRIKILKMLNEYDLINEYEGKFLDYSKRVWAI